MKEKTDNRVPVLMVLVAVLVLAVAAQSIVILRLHKTPGAAAPALEPVGASIITSDDADDAPSPGVPPPIPFNDAFFNGGLGDWDPFREMHSIHDQINQMFGNAFNRFHGSDDFKNRFGDYRFSPDINLEDKGDSYVVTVDLPGMEESRIDITINGQTLIISGTMQTGKREKDDGTMLRQERRSGSFKRIVTFPGPVESGKMETENKKGVLYIEIPKGNE